MADLPTISLDTATLWTTIGACGAAIIAASRIVWSGLKRAATWLAYEIIVPTVDAHKKHLLEMQHVGRETSESVASLVKVCMDTSINAATAVTASKELLHSTAQLRSEILCCQLEHGSTQFSHVTSRTATTVSLDWTDYRASNVVAVNKYLLELLAIQKAGHYSELVIDVRGVVSLSSQTVGELLRARKRVDNEPVKVSLINAGPTIAETLAVTRVDQLITVRRETIPISQNEGAQNVKS